MERMLVTQALDERDLLKKRITDAVNHSTFCMTRKPESDMVSDGKGTKLDEFNKKAESQMQKITDLINRYERLDTAILIDNATTTIKVAGKEMTRAAAINLRKVLLGYSEKDVDFRKVLIDKLKLDLSLSKQVIAKTQGVADKQKETMTANISSSDKKDISTEAMVSIDKYCESLVEVLVDPISIEDKINALIDEREELISNLETAIKISNATTFIEF